MKKNNNEVRYYRNTETNEAIMTAEKMESPWKEIDHWNYMDYVSYKAYKESKGYSFLNRNRPFTFNTSHPKKD